MLLIASRGSMREPDNQYKIYIYIYSNTVFYAENHSVLLEISSSAVKVRKRQKLTL